jgi:hypothetical protein
MTSTTHVPPEMLSAYLDGELSAAERSRVSSHLEVCAICRERFTSLEATVALVRDLDPQMAPEGLREAVAAGLTARSPSLSRSRPLLALPRWLPGWRVTGAAVALVLVGLFTVNLLRGTTQNALDWRAAQPEVGGGLRPVGPEAPPRSGVGESPKVADQTIPTPSRAGPLVLRRVIRTAGLAIEVEEFETGARRIIVIAESAGGFVASSSYAQGPSGQGPSQGSFVLRVPAPRFAETLAALEALGLVRERRVSGQDVSEEFVDLQARVRNLERHEQQLLTFMDRATKVSDLLAIEQELARVRGEIEALTGRLRVLGNQVELATIEVALRQKPEKAAAGFWDIGATVERILGAFLHTVRQILQVAEGAAVVISALIPVAALVLLGWVILRRVRARMV